MEKEKLYNLQNEVILKLQKNLGSTFNDAKLCGGTALARCFFDHRLSYDLDYFLPEGFKAKDFATVFKKSDLKFDLVDIVDDPKKANQIHGFIYLDNDYIKVSFIEDAYYNLFPAINKKIGNIIVKTEDISGLYHRKLRTVSGSTEDGEEVIGGRQTARDLFDLFVLSQKHMPIKDFVETLPYIFPYMAFVNGLVNMPWYDLNNDLKNIKAVPEWQHATDINYLQNYLLEQIDAKLIVDVFDFENIEEKTKRGLK